MVRACWSACCFRYCVIDVDPVVQQDVIPGRQAALERTTFGLVVDVDVMRRARQHKHIDRVVAHELVDCIPMPIDNRGPCRRTPAARRARAKSAATDRPHPDKPAGRRDARRALQACSTPSRRANVRRTWPSGCPNIEHGDVVARPSRHVIPVVRLAGRKITAAGDSDDVKVIGELEREAVVDVRVVAEAGEQHHLAKIPRAAPIENLEPDARLDFHERHLVWRRIACSAMRFSAAARASTTPRYFHP